MPKAIVEALAETTAHGISRVATSRSRAMKVMWCLLFLFFLVLFARTAVTLVLRLREDSLTTSFELNKVPFVFPDLYFCPSNPYSGSFPYAMAPAEAELINSALANLSAEFDVRYGPRGEMGLRTRLVQNSLPVHLSTQLLAQRMSEVVQQKSSMPTMGLPPRFLMPLRIQPFSHPENLVCFMLNLTDAQRLKIVSDRWQINLRLSTDPHFADFNYSGQGVEPIRDPASGAEVPLHEWSLRYGSDRLQETGFTMLIVPQGAYPSLAHEAKFLLAPGNSYSVALSMEETLFSEDLHGRHCKVDNAAVDFVDYLTGEPLTFAYSPAACYYDTIAQLISEQYGCLVASLPLVWRLRGTPRCLNMTETSQEVMDRLQRTRMDWFAVDRQVQKTCLLQQPCRSRQYSASFSFARWPRLGSSAVRHFAEYSTSPGRKLSPAIGRLIEMAKALQSGNHTSHSESTFRAYLSESQIQLRIVVQRTTSPLVTISPAYSATAFLADAGGLPGLYVGCSLLTVCELIELLYRVLSEAIGKRCCRKPESARQAEADQNGTDEGNDEAKRLDDDGRDIENNAGVESV